MLGSDCLLWTCDGKGGPDDPNTLMSILLKFLLAEGNYNKYRGGPSSLGKGKLHWASLLSTQMKEAGIRRYRSPKAIWNKISNLEETFREAHDWAGQTGARVKEDDPQSFRGYILKKCPYYFDLLDGVMQDRSTSRPNFTSDDLCRDSDTEDDDSTPPNHGIGDDSSDDDIIPSRGVRQPTSTNQPTLTNQPVLRPNTPTTQVAQPNTPSNLSVARSVARSTSSQKTVSRKSDPVLWAMCSKLIVRNILL